MDASRPRVHGIGGVFFKSRDPAALAAWYARHLGFPVSEWGGAQFDWRRADNGQAAGTVWAPFAEDTGYFAPGDKPYMLNLRVDDLAGLLETLRAEGCQVLDRREEGELGSFGYVVDPDGTLLELWQAPADAAR
jgi:catechol 2,3-dioxygenase-like lactoylglutathione lyase family enzyme